MIKVVNGKYKYFDRNDVEITEGCKIKYSDGTIKKVYLTSENELGIDATNPKWIESGRAFPCEYGIYPLGNNQTNKVEVVTE